ncbi:hypothetical protein Hydth_0081 [Hydrogenobacter thermophilus TK-6]|uniref:Uncharacterized protein n=1 Tax=Hydrogenobacter thermophilus (strain DSM 6534 / IAM 12695 / TK-6) TaxID=608538 RepID=D3DFE5_HYDTT|nr:DsrE family protein [Hydrogenobacter thermophilus]ADO44491.1 hypothetical protein Hydth_0081 [Hydrogenobacter thermophilus TK-6]BAI68547.1 hypothetical protein HTH_0080 [Hydrogenobacter thermophilus TK-6]
MRSIALILTNLLAVLVLTIYAQEAHDKTHQAQKEGAILVVNLTHDRGISAEMALTFANISLGRGYETVVWLNSEGVRLADAKAKETQAIKLLREFLSKGGKVYVCPVCAQKLKVEKIASGTQWANPDIIFPLITQEKTKIVSW